ncbi:MAG: efflux RND transporter permease subunit [Planctomycetota bacterium]|nr:efflux RND transporter permease subunit [Planctomycetota bacterium]
MLTRLIKFSIDHAALVLVVAGAVLAWAAMRLPGIPVDVFPELNAPTVVIMTESPGLAADEVEQYVTIPIESSVNGIPGVRRVRTTSAIGLGVTYVEFDWGTDVYRARQLVSERLDAIREELPPDVHAEMTPVTSITGEIMLLAVASPDGSVSALDLRAYAEFDLRKKLLAVQGVAQVSVIGGELPEYQVLVDRARLRLHGLTLTDVIDAAGESHTTASAGYLPDADHHEIPIRQTGRVQSAQDIAQTLVAYRDGVAVTIGQVAEVRVGPAPRRGTGSYDGRPAIVLTVQKAPGTNTLVVTGKIDAMLDGLDTSTPAGIQVNREVFRQSHFISRSIDNVVHALRDAAIIVAVIILLFLLSVRTTLITLTALPLSIAAALLAMEWMGETVNVMTLGGLAIAVGSLVDDAIIDVENVVRRLRENAALPPDRQRSAQEVIFAASNEIRPAMVFATVIIAMVFLPLMFLEGIEGRFFRPLGIAFVIALMASLLVALTVTPAMCRLLLGRVVRGVSGASVGDGGIHPAGQTSGHGDGPLVRVLKRAYRPAIELALRWRAAVMIGAGVATALSLWLASTFGTSFLPSFNEGTMTVFLFSPPGTSLDSTDRLASSVERQLLQIDGIVSVTRRTGRAERDEHAEPVSNSEMDVILAPEADMESVRAEVRRLLAGIPGITTNIGQPIEHRLSHILSGTPAAIAISISGNDLDVLRAISKEVDAALGEVPGARDIAANREVMIQSLPVIYRPRELAAYGLTPASAAAQVQAAVQGVRVAEVNEGATRLSLVVRSVESERDGVEDIRRVELRGQGGAIVQLGEVATIGPEMASNLIAREGGQRRAVVTLNVADGANLGDLIAAVRERVDPIVQRHGYSVHYGGQFEAQQSASRTMLVYGGLVGILVLLLLHLATGSLRVSLLVLVNLPLALIGGVVAIFVTESPDVIHNMGALVGGGTYVAPVISIASLVGFITLFGIAVRNGILLVNHYRHLTEVDGIGLREAIVRGSMERLVPILMTALCAALALIPIIWQGHRSGNELLAPLSVVILGGLLSSTFLNLIVVPVGYAALHRLR